MCGPGCSLLDLSLEPGIGTGVRQRQKIKSSADCGEDNNLEVMIAFLMVSASCPERALAWSETAGGEDGVGIEGGFEQEVDRGGHPTKNVSRRAIRDICSLFESWRGEQKGDMAVRGGNRFQDLPRGFGQARGGLAVRACGEECEIDRPAGAGY